MKGIVMSVGIPTLLVVSLLLGVVTLFTIEEAKVLRVVEKTTRAR